MLITHSMCWFTLRSTIWGWRSTVGIKSAVSCKRMVPSLYTTCLHTGSWGSSVSGGYASLDFLQKKSELRVLLVRQLVPLDNMRVEQLAVVGKHRHHHKFQRTKVKRIYLQATFYELLQCFRSWNCASIGCETDELCNYLSPYPSRNSFHQKVIARDFRPLWIPHHYPHHLHPHLEASSHHHHHQKRIPVRWVSQQDETFLWDCLVLYLPRSQLDRPVKQKKVNDAIKMDN